MRGDPGRFGRARAGAVLAIALLVVGCTQPGASAPPSPSDSGMMEHSPSASDSGMMEHSPSASDSGMMEHSPSPSDSGMMEHSPSPSQ
jgi:hypothetical protein